MADLLHDRRRRSHQRTDDTGPGSEATMPARSSLFRTWPGAMIVALAATVALGLLLPGDAAGFLLWGVVSAVGLAMVALSFVHRRGVSPYFAADASSASHADARDGLSGRRPVARRPLVPSTIVGEVDLYGLRLTVGAEGGTAFRLSVFAVPLGDQATGMVALLAGREMSVGDLKCALKLAFRASAGPQEAGLRFLKFVTGDCRIESALVAIWDRRARKLSYVAAGLEPPVVLNAGWPHGLDSPVVLPGRHGPRELTFGVHRLLTHERWLLYSRPLIDVSDPHDQPFNAVGLVQYAHDDRAMPSDQWVDYLLELGLKAHGGSLPDGSLLISLACEVPAGADLDGPSQPRMTEDPKGPESSPPPWRDSQ